MYINYPEKERIYEEDLKTKISFPIVWWVLIRSKRLLEGAKSGSLCLPICNLGHVTSLKLHYLPSWKIGESNLLAYPIA